jgi:hypothetical protein
MVVITVKGNILIVDKAIFILTIPHIIKTDHNLSTSLVLSIVPETNFPLKDFLGSTGISTQY